MADIGKLIGKKVKEIYMNEEFLKFVTDDGNIVFGVQGDCCSQSVFYDFYGVKKLFKNGAIKSAKKIDLEPDDIKTTEDVYKIDGCKIQKDKKSYQESIKVYGYELVTEDEKLGEVTSVFSFRNYSNGNYGGYMNNVADDTEVKPQIFDDVTETVAVKD